jgi:hypothetical protein
MRAAGSGVFRCDLTSRNAEVACNRSAVALSPLANATTFG